MIQIEMDREWQKMASSCIWLRAREIRHHSEVLIAPGRMPWALMWERRHGPPADTQMHNADTQFWCLPHSSGPYCLIWMIRGGGPYLQGSRHEPHSMEPHFNYFLKLLMLFMALCTSNILSLLIVICSSVACFYSMLVCELHLINESV